MKQIWIILILALVVRICFLAFAMPEGIEFRQDTTSDAPFFDRLATNITEGKWFINKDGKSIFTPPAYPVFLAGIYYVFSHNYDWIRVVQALLWVVICVLIYFLGKEIFNKKIGLIAGLLAAVYPGFIIEPIKILKTTLFTFLLVCFVLYFVKAIKKNSLKHFAISGLILGLTALTRTVIIYFPIIIFIYLLIVCKNKKRALLSFLIVVVVAGIVVAPWSIRNHIQTKQDYPSLKEPTTIISGAGLESGFPTSADVKRQVKVKGLFFKFYKIYGFPHNLSYVQSYGYKDTLTNFIKGKADLKELVQLMKQGTFWAKFGFLILYYVVLLASLMGLLYLYKRWRLGLFLVFIVGYISGVPLIYAGVTSPAPRYKFYIMPFIIILAVYGIKQIVMGLKQVITDNSRKSDKI